MYRFPDPNDEATIKRRDLLDEYGFIAHVSALVPLIIIYCGTIISQRHQNQLAYRDTQITNVRLKSSSTWRRKFVWWCCSPFEIAGYHLGTRGVLLSATAWTMWLLVLTFLQTDQDYIHLSGRFGIIAVSQLPLHYVLSLKTSHSPVQIIAQTCGENLIQIHKQLGYIMTLFFCVHTALYVNFFVQTNLLLGKLTQRYIQCGTIGMIALMIIAVTAFKPIRNRSYQVFYISHVVLSICLIPFLYFHGSHMRIYLWETLAVYIFNRLFRFWSTATNTGTIQKISGSGLLEIKIPLTASSDTNSASWQPGQYAYVSIAGNPWLRIFRSNPFTIASIAVTDEEMRFVARVRAGITAKMTQFHSFEGSLKLSVEGPYGHSNLQQALFNCSRVLFVAGGIGGTFISPLYRQLLHHSRNSVQGDPAINFDFVWIARSMADISWALPDNEEEIKQFASRLQVYLTRTTSARSSTTQDTTDGREKQNGRTQLEAREAVFSDEQKGLLSSADFNEKSNANGLSVTSGRPDLARLVEQLFSNNETDRVAVVVCGPPELAHDLRKEVGHWISKGRDCFWWGETFGL